MRLRDWLAQAQSALEAAGIESARLEAQLLASHVLLVDRTWIVANPDSEFPELAGMSLLDRRLNREPLAYILERREFYGREFIVGPGVLIPRQETEVIVDAALELPATHARVLDIGTGSGCIAITLSLERPDWQVTGSDISERALEVARRNSELLHARVDWIHADGGKGVDDQKFDLILSNPPYVARGDALSPEIRDFEPELALYATGNGLDFYVRLSKETPFLLSDEGVLILELGDDQFGPVREIFDGAGWAFLKEWTDLLGITRAISFGWPVHE